MSSQSPSIHYLKDYTPPTFFIEKTELVFHLNEENTLVESKLFFSKNRKSTAKENRLILDGQELELLDVILNGRVLGAEQYGLDEDHLTIPDLPDQFTLEIKNRIQPQNNTSLEGLYKSSGNFCTQCEAEGFRKITYFLDRPDVMSRFTTTIYADKAKYPALLSNGNLVDQGEEGDKHWAKWEDPFKKPAYLFALVAGDLLYQEDFFTTRSGKKVTLRIYVEKENIEKCDHAMHSLKQAMKWDEDIFGLEYDLDIYMIVAVNDFNMGAMENKGLNVFNSKYVLANPETATDTDYNYIQEVIAHEYFHNWTGNRVTCRDWFQLSLKEGLTVFRDQEFSANMTSGAVKRIDDVRILRLYQFPEDAGPMAHPVRPDSYIEINNFYTSTVYNKGAEVIRMIRNIVTEKGFRKGMDLYFQRHDGQAVTTDDFVKAMEDANGVDLSQFRRWYSQSGTPEIKVRFEYNQDQKTFVIDFEQKCPATPGQPKKEPYHIPVAIGLIGESGNKIPLQLEEGKAATEDTVVLNLKEKQESFTFHHVAERPFPSIIRGFSAPVNVKVDFSESDLAFLLAHDSDDFNRWDASQQLSVRTILNLIEKYLAGEKSEVSSTFVSAFQKVLRAPSLDNSLIAQILTLPSESYLGDLMDIIEVDGIHHVRKFVKKALARSLRDDFLAVYHQNNEKEEYKVDMLSMGKRSLKNVCLDYLMTLEDEEISAICLRQFQTANNLTDKISALKILADYDIPERESSLASFYDSWKNDPLVLDKWFGIQAQSDLPNMLETVRGLMQNKAFEITNPNKVRSLIGVFCHQNPVRFHSESGDGYRFLTDMVLQLNKINPQISARLLTAFSRWKKLNTVRQNLIKEQLEKITQTPNLSSDVFEIASKCLK